MDFTFNNIRINFKNIPTVLIKNYRIMLLVIIPSFIFAVMFCIFVPRKYSSDFLIIPPKLSDAGSGLSPAVAAMGLVGISQNRGGSIDMTISLLQTREISHLVGQYISKDPKYKSKSYQPYQVDYVPDLRSGFLDIVVTSKSPEYSRDVANYIITALGKHISNIAISKAMQKANFYTQQLEIAKNNRDVAESKLLAFKTKYGITAGSQDAIVGSMITSLQAQYVAQQTSLDSLKAYLTPDNPDYKSAVAQLDAIKQQIIELNNTVSHSTDDKNNESDNINQFLAPNNTSEFEMLQDEYNLRSLIYSVLVKQYEANNLDLQSEQDPVSIDVIDPPIVPTSYSYPIVKRTLMLTLAVSSILSVLLVLGLNWRKLIYNDNV